MHMYVCMYTMCMLGVCRDQQMGSDTLDWSYGGCEAFCGHCELNLGPPEE